MYFQIAFVTIVSLLTLDATSGAVDNLSGKSTCWNLPAVDIDLQQLKGLWYVQAYTLPGGFNSKCELAEYVINPNGQGGRVTTTFTSTQTNETITMVRKFSKKQDGESFRYVVDEGEFDASVKLVSFSENDSYTACVTVPSEDEISIAVVATRKRKVKKDVLRKLLQSKGGNLQHLHFVDQENCENEK